MLRSSNSWNRRVYGLSEELVSSIYTNEKNVESVIENSSQLCTVPDGELIKSNPIYMRKIILAFSILQNCKKIFSTTVSKDDLGYVHGIRFLRKS